MGDSRRIPRLIALAGPPQDRAVLSVHRNDRRLGSTGVHEDAIGEHERGFAQSPGDIAAAELLQHVDLPDGFPGCRIERRQVAARPVGIDGPAVDRWRRARTITTVIAEPRAVCDLPQLLAGGLVESHHVFGPAPGAKRIDLAADNGERRVPFARPFCGPGKSRPALRPRFHQPFLDRNPVAILPAPLGPIIECEV